MKYYRIEFENGYCGCQQEDYIKAESYDEAVEYAREEVYSYAESYSHVAFGWDEEPTEEEQDDYLEGCSYSISEISKEEFEENS